MYTRFDMKKIVLWLTVTMFIAFGIAGTLFFTGISGIPLFWSNNGNISWGTENGKISSNVSSSDQSNSNKADGVSSVDQNTSDKVDGIKKIEVNSVSAKVNIIPSDTQEVKAHLHGTAAEVPKLTSSVSGDLLQIKVEYPVTIGVHLTYSSMTLDVEIPKAYGGEFKGETVSGPFDIHDFNFAAMSIKSVSGKILAKNINTKNTTIQTTSGTTDLENLNGGLSFKSVSGELNAKLTDNQDKVDISTTSGGIDIAGLGGELNFTSVSGALEADFAKVSSNVKLHSTSGTLHLKLPESSDFSLDFKTTSGGFKSSFPLTMDNNDKHRVTGSVNKGGNQIQADTVSGALELIKK